MPIKLAVISHKGRELPVGFEFAFDHGSFTIGRSQNDGFVLNDPDLVVSRGHAAVYSSGERYAIQNRKPNNFTIINGVYLEKEEKTYLNDGDIIEIGEYRIAVSISPPAKPNPGAMPPADLDNAPKAPSVTPGTGDDWWLQYITNDSAPEPPPAPTPPPVETSRPPAEPVPGPMHPPETLDAASQDPIGLKHFLHGLGLPPGDIEALCDQNDPRVLYEYGRVMRTALVGISEVLIARRIFKENMVNEHTQLMPARNNALKVIPDINHALRLMIRQENKAYMPLNVSVEDAIIDIKAHQMALMAGLNTAVAAVIGHFDPQRLEQKLKGTIVLQRKAKYWELFKEQYEWIAREADDNFRKLIGPEFAKTYLRQSDNVRQQHHKMKDERG